MKSKINPRKKALDSICAKIAIFLVSETYTSEQDAQGWLSEAVKCLDNAAAILVANDEKSEGAARE